MIYVMSDIHGELVKFKKILELIEFSENDTLYVLGDMIDRGKFPITTLLKCLRTENIIPLMGNHEKMMLEYFEDVSLTGWLYNGGGTTMEQLYEMKKENREALIEEVKNLPIYIVLPLKNRLFVLVHAGMEAYDNGSIKDTQTEDFMLWARQEFYGQTKLNNSNIVIFGHTPTKHLYGRPNIWHGENMIGIDCGCAYNGKLACLRLDDMEEFYV